MFARGIGGRMSGRRLVAASVAIAAPVTPLTIFTSGGAPVLWLRGDLGMNGATTITSWNDQSASGHNMTPLVQGPGVAAADATLGGLPTVLLSTGTALSTAMALAPIFSYRAVVKLKTWFNTGMIIGDPAVLRGAVTMAGTTPDIYLNNTSYTDNVTPAVGTWYRLRADFTNSVSDLLRLGPLIGTGVNAGASAPTQLGLNASGGLPQLSESYYWELVVLPYRPTGAEDAAFDAYVSAKTGGIPLL